MSGLPPPNRGGGPPGRGGVPPPAETPPLQIKVGWFKEGTLTIRDVGMTFEKICLPRNLLHVQMGQFDALLTVRTQEDIKNIQHALSHGGVNILDQKLLEYMVIGNAQTGPPPNQPPNMPPAKGGPPTNLPPPAMPIGAALPIPGGALPPPGGVLPLPGGLPAPGGGLPPPGPGMPPPNLPSGTKSTEPEVMIISDKKSSPQKPRGHSRERRTGDRSSDRRDRRDTDRRDGDRRDTDRRDSEKRSGDRRDTDRRRSPERSRPRRDRTPEKRDRDRKTAKSEDRNSPRHDRKPAKIVPDLKPIKTRNLHASTLKEEIEKRRKLLVEFRDSCKPFMNKAEQIFPLKHEQKALILKRDTIQRKHECVVLALDKKAEPYMAWLVQELKKNNTDEVPFRVDSVKCYESSLANEESVAQHSFEQGALLVISANSLNEDKRSVTVHICMNGLNQIHKNMGAGEAFRMIEEQWETYLTSVSKLTSKSHLPSRQVENLLKRVSDGKQLQKAQYDDLIKYLTDKRDTSSKSKSSASKTLNSEGQPDTNVLIDKLTGMFGADGSGLNEIMKSRNANKSSDCISIHSRSGTQSPMQIEAIGGGNIPASHPNFTNLPPPGLPVPNGLALPHPMMGVPPVNVFTSQIFR